MKDTSPNENQKHLSATDGDNISVAHAEIFTTVNSGGTQNITYNIFRDRADLSKILLFGISKDLGLSVWNFKEPHEPADNQQVVYNGKSTKPTSLELMLHKGKNLVIVGHKAGIDIYDTKLSLENQILMPEVDVEIGQVNSIAPIRDKIYCSHFDLNDPLADKYRGIFEVSLGGLIKKPSFKTIVNKKGGYIHKMNDQLYFSDGFGVYNMNNPARPTALTLALISALDSYNNKLQVCDIEGRYYELPSKRTKKPQEGMLMFTPKQTINTMCNVEHNGQHILLVGTAEGYVLGENRTKNEYIGEDAIGIDPEKPGIFNIYTPNHETVFICTGNRVISYSIVDLLSFLDEDEQRAIDPIPYKGLGRSVSAVKLLGVENR